MNVRSRRVNRGRVVEDPFHREVHQFFVEPVVHPEQAVEDIVINQKRRVVEGTMWRPRAQDAIVAQRLPDATYPLTHLRLPALGHLRLIPYSDVEVGRFLDWLLRTGKHERVRPYLSGGEILRQLTIGGPN